MSGRKPCFLAWLPMSEMDFPTRGTSKGHPNASHWKLNSNYFYPLYLGIWVTKENTAQSTLNGKMLLLTLRRERTRSTRIVCVRPSSLKSVPGSWCGAIGQYASLSCPCRKTQPYFHGVCYTESWGMTGMHWHTHLGRTMKHPLIMKLEKILQPLSTGLVQTVWAFYLLVRKCSGPRSIVNEE